MVECPWCHAQVQDARLDGPCPRCGKQARDLRTTDPPEAPERSARAVPMLEVPDLVLPAAKPAASRPTPAHAPAAAPTASDGEGLDLQIDLGAVGGPPPPPSMPVSGAAHDPFEDDLSAGPALELDVGGGSLPPRLSPVAPISPVISPPPAPISQGSLAPESPSSGALPPTEAQPSAPPKPAVDPFEARALADYGPPPEAFWQAPLYAYRVFVRRGDLQRLLVQKRANAEAVARRAEDGWVAFGERAREALERNGGRGLEHVVAAEQVLRGRDGAIAGAMDAHKAELAEIDVRLGAAEGELGRVRQEQERFTALWEAADEDRKRSDAKLKRLDIEIRNAGGDPSARAAERNALAGDVATKEPKVAEASARLAAAQQATRAVQAKVDAVRAERKAAEDRFARQVGTRSDGVEEARRQLRAALVALGRSMLADASTADLGTARTEIARLDEEAQAAAKQVALHEAATSSYDVGKLMLGVGVVVVGVVLLLVLVLFPFIYRALAT